MKPKRIIRDVSDRKGIIGGSSIGGALGLSTYTTPYDAYRQFLGLDPTEEITPDLQETFTMGHELEGFVAKQVDRIYNVKTMSTQYAYVHPQYDWLICHPDRILRGKIEGKTVGIEIKTSSTFDSVRWGTPETDEVPMDYLCQCHSYMMCGVCDVVWLVRFSNNRITRYIIERDEELEDAILSKLVAFVDNARAGIEPPITSLEDAKREYNRDTSGDIEADEEISKIVDKLNDLKTQIKTLTGESDSYRAQIISYMKDKKCLVSGGQILAKYTKSTVARLDTKRLKEEKPEIYKEYSSESISMRLS